MNNLPIHKHDCSCCVFLGNHIDKNFPAELDLYFCSQSSTTPTVIARYSSEPSEYMSGILGAKYWLKDYKASHPDNTLSSVEILRNTKSEFKTPLFEAAARSIEKILIDENLDKASTYRPSLKF